MRYIPHSEKHYEAMLKTIGVSSFEDLLSLIPGSIRVKEDWTEEGLNERDLTEKYSSLASFNNSLDIVDSYIGGGAYEHFVPSVVNHMASKPEFVTSYTQYQPESNQGMLQALFEYQSLMCALTGMDVSNVSHYDGSTALVEAVNMALGRKKGKICFSKFLNPFYKKVMETYLPGEVDNFKEINPVSGLFDSKSIAEENISAIIVQSPNFLGCIEDIENLSKFAKEKDALLIACVYPMSLGILKSPGELGADIVVGEGQALGNYLSFGGPYFGFMCVKKDLMRKMPGRIIGETTDLEGRKGYVLTLQAREQHIRREKAVSNICSNQALCALRAAVYLTYLGEQGFRNVSRECFEKAHYLQENLCSLKGIKLLFSKPFFNEFAITVDKKDIETILNSLREEGILGGINIKRFYPDIKNSLLISVTEVKSMEALDTFVAVMKELVKA
ncbi:MAG: hypothetical protein ACD_79C00393G0002 [uncultured bacterium]|nr:MAG: hypothetical protein ACD_79C00393G0002 [uncultured bacterium]